MPAESHEFSATEKAGLYRAIFVRRDVRRFRPDPIPAVTLARLLEAAHHAPSVGFMQPWNFVLLQDLGVRRQIEAAFRRANAEAVEKFEGARREKYATLKLEGILEAPLNVCVTCDRSRFGPVVLGRTCQPDMDRYSTVCAVQNFWLAARAEGIAVGWVSILHYEDLERILHLPATVVPVAYLCVGYTDTFPSQPELQTAGWLPRLSLADMVRFATWDSEPPAMWDELRRALEGR
jgi:5,6-dimethylbenzimidazole synthase